MRYDDAGATVPSRVVATTHIISGTVPSRYRLPCASAGARAAARHLTYVRLAPGLREVGRFEADVGHTKPERPAPDRSARAVDDFTLAAETLRPPRQDESMSRKRCSREMAATGKGEGQAHPTAATWRKGHGREQDLSGSGHGRRDGNICIVGAGSDKDTSSKRGAKRHGLYQGQRCGKRRVR